MSPSQKSENNFNRKEELMKKNIKNKKNVALSLLGIGMVLALNACSASGQSANAATLSSAESITKGEKTVITIQNDTVSINGNGATAEGKTITINEAGTYQFSGKLSEGQIKLKTDGNVNFIFDNFSLSNSKVAPIVGETGNLNIYLNENTENTVSDQRAANTEEENTSNVSTNAQNGDGNSNENAKTDTSGETYDAAIYSENDITISGKGKLTVEGGYEDAIHSKTNLTIENGTYTITASHHGLNAKKLLTVKDGSFDITTVEDALHSKGDVTVEKGSIDINAGDDALHADNTLTVKDGTINIKNSNEGLEGITVNVEGGDIAISSTDDGINAAGESEDGSSVNYAINISGGKIKIVPGGDGIDSNGDLNVSGGTIIVDGPSDGGNAPIDYDGTATVTGGTILASGNSGMFQGFNGNNSTQSSIIYYLDGNANAGDTIKVTDESGKEIFSASDLTQSYNAVLYSGPELENGKTYKISAGSNEESVTINDTTNTIGNGGMGTGMGQPPMGGQGQGNGQNNMPGQPPMGGNSQGGMQGQPPMGGQGQRGSHGQNNGQNGMGQPPMMGNNGQNDGNDQGRPPMPPMGENGQGGMQGQPPMDGQGQRGGRGQNGGNDMGQPPMMGGNEQRSGQNQDQGQNSGSKKKNKSKSSSNKNSQHNKPQKRNNAGSAKQNNAGSAKPNNNEANSQKQNTNNAAKPNDATSGSTPTN